MYKKSKLYLFPKLLNILFQISAWFAALIISFIFCDYKTLPQLSLALFQIQGLLSHQLIIVAYVQVCVFLSITFSVCLMLIACMFSELTIWYWITSWFALPWGKLFLPLLVVFSCL